MSQLERKSIRLNQDDLQNLVNLARLEDSAIVFNNDAEGCYIDFRYKDQVFEGVRFEDLYLFVSYLGCKDITGAGWAEFLDACKKKRAEYLAQDQKREPIIKSVEVDIVRVKRYDNGKLVSESVYEDAAGILTGVLSLGDVEVETGKMVRKAQLN